MNLLIEVLGLAMDADPRAKGRNSGRTKEDSQSENFGAPRPSRPIPSRGAKGWGRDVRGSGAEEISRAALGLLEGWVRRDAGGEACEGCDGAAERAPVLGSGVCQRFVCFSARVAACVGVFVCMHACMHMATKNCHADVGLDVCMTRARKPDARAELSAQSVYRLMFICGLRCDHDDKDSGQRAHAVDFVSRLSALGIAVVDGLLAKGQRGAATRTIALLNLWHRFPCQGLIDLFLASEDWEAAVEACEEGGSAEEREGLVERLVAESKFKHALRLCQNPCVRAAVQANTRHAYTKFSIAKLVVKSQVQMALQLAGGDTGYQVDVVQGLIGLGRLGEAMELRERLGLQQLVEQVDASQVEQQNRALARGQLGLPGHMPCDTIIFVDCRAALSHAAARIREGLLLPAQTRNGSGGTAAWVEGAVSSVDVVGLDVEWKPACSRMEQENPASILQVAWRAGLIIFDLLWMRRALLTAAGPRGSGGEGGGGEGGGGEGAGDTLQMTDVIQEVLTSESVLKLGFDFRNDVAKLRASFPECTCFDRVYPMLDIASWSRGINGSGGNSLRQTVLACLGRTLDKRCQVSDWERRPLSAQQLEYAALDAYVLCQVFDSFPASSPARFQNGKWTSLVHAIDACEPPASKSGKAAAKGEGGARLPGPGDHGRTDSRPDMCSAAAAGRCDDELRLRGPKNVQDWLGVLSPQGGGDGWIVGRMLAAPEDSGVGVVECKSSQDAAAAFGLSVERVGKVLAFAVGAGQFVAVVTRGAQRLASAKLASVFKCSRRRVRPATAGECAAVFGFVASEIPPGAFAQPSSVCVVMDPGLWPAGTAAPDRAPDANAQGGCREEDGCGSAALRDLAAMAALGGDAAGQASQLLFRTGRAWVGVMLTPSEVLACHRAHGHQVRVADVLEPPPAAAGAAPDPCTRASEPWAAAPSRAGGGAAESAAVGGGATGTGPCGIRAGAVGTRDASGGEAQLLSLLTSSTLDGVLPSGPDAARMARAAAVAAANWLAGDADKGVARGQQQQRRRQAEAKQSGPADRQELTAAAGKSQALSDLVPFGEACDAEGKGLRAVLREDSQESDGLGEPSAAAAVLDGQAAAEAAQLLLSGVGGIGSKTATIQSQDQLKHHFPEAVVGVKVSLGNAIGA